MTESFNLPDLGEGVHEAEVLSVHIKAGQEVRENDIILEVETDKAAVEIPSPFTGKIIEVFVKPGDTVMVGDAMISYVWEGVQEESAEPVSSPPLQEKDQTPSATAVTGSTKIVPASPATRRLARELGVDLNHVTPTGASGVVTADDVRKIAEAQVEPPQPQATTATEEKLALDENIPQDTPQKPVKQDPLPDFSQWGEIAREPLRSIRKATARQMAKSWSQIPHVATQDTVDITKLEAFRKKHKEEIKAAGGRLTLTVFALKAVATALKRYPHFNASLDMDQQEIVIKNYFHIGVAADTDRGLLVPVIKDVDRKSIKEVAIELHEQIEKTRTGKIAREDLQGGTFTITNAGAAGGGTFTAIINHPEVAIMGLGQARMQPVVMEKDDNEYEIEPRLMMPIVLCFDHRVVDGADTIRFLRVIIDALEDPDELLITMI